MVVNAQDYGFEPSETPRTDRSVSPCLFIFLNRKFNYFSFMSFFFLFLSLHWLSSLAGYSVQLLSLLFKPLKVISDSVI